MNKLNAQKFMNLFNSMLSDRNGNKVDLKKIPTVTPELAKGDEIDIATAQKEEQLETRLNERNLLFLKKVEAAKKKIEWGSQIRSYVFVTRLAREEFYCDMTSS